MEKAFVITFLPHEYNRHGHFPEALHYFSDKLGLECPKAYGVTEEEQQELRII